MKQCEWDMRRLVGCAAWMQGLKPAGWKFAVGEALPNFSNSCLCGPGLSCVGWK